MPAGLFLARQSARCGKDDRITDKKGVTDVGKNVSYRDILRHHANRMSQSQIANACGCARSTVQDVLKKAAEKGVSREDVAGLSEQAAYELVRAGRATNRRDSPGSTSRESGGRWSATAR
jgi:hypothetical protein